MKRILVVILAILLSIGLLAGCNNKTPAATTTPDDSSTAVTTDNGDSEPAPVDITFWFYPMWDSAEQVLGADFAAFVKQEYPWITLNYEVLSYDAGPEKFTVAMATGATPDIIYDGYGRLAPAVSSGLVVDVTDLVDEITPYLTIDVNHAGMVDGRNYAIDVDQMIGYVMMVNTTLAKDLGVYDQLPADRLHWSYDDFLNMMRDAQAADPNVYGIPLWAGSRSSDSWYYSWLLSADVPITKSDFSGMDVVGRPGAVNVLDTLKLIVDEGLSPPGAATTTDLDVQSYWITQQCLFTNNGFGMQMAWQNEMDAGELDPFDTELVAIPTPDGKADPKSVTWGAESFVIFKNNNDEAKIDAAKKVLALFYKNPQFAKEISENYGPTLIKGSEPEFAHQFLADSLVWSLDFTNKYATADFGIMEPWWSDFRETFYVELQGVFTGALTSEQALENWTESGEAVLAAAQ